MANIKITVDGPLMDGHKITFKAPCNCDVVEKLDVRYVENSTQKSKSFTMKDSHGNDLTGLGNLFYKDAYVDVVLDPNSGSAYLQNAGTNAYLEEKLKTAGTPVDNLLSDRADLPLSARQGKILNDSLQWKFIKELTAVGHNFTIPTNAKELKFVIALTSGNGNNIQDCILSDWSKPTIAIGNVVHIIRFTNSNKIMTIELLKALSSFGSVSFADVSTTNVKVYYR